MTARSVQDRFNTIKTTKELTRIGECGEEPSDYELLLEELMEPSEDSDRKIIRTNASSLSERLMKLKRKAVETGKSIILGKSKLGFHTRYCPSRHWVKVTGFLVRKQLSGTIFFI